jgi:hypothetical protein
MFFLAHPAHTVTTTEYIFNRDRDGCSISIFDRSLESARRQFSGDYTFVGTANRTFRNAEKSHAVAAELSTLDRATWLAYPANSGVDADFVLRSEARGLSIWFHHDTSKYNGFGGKLGASYDRPNDGQGRWVTIYSGGEQVGNPSIGFGASKTNAQIAKDISRRLLPEAETFNARVLADIAKLDAYEAATVAAQQAAAGLSPVNGLTFTASGRDVEVRACLSIEQATRLRAELASFPELLRILKNVTFVAEGTAHLKGLEREILPVTGEARALLDEFSK